MVGEAALPSRASKLLGWGKGARVPQQRTTQGQALRGGRSCPERRNSARGAAELAMRLSAPASGSPDAASSAIIDALAPQLMQWLQGLKSQQGSLDWEPVSATLSLTFFADASGLLPCLPAADASVWRWPTSSTFCWRACGLETNASGHIIDVAMLAVTGTRTATKQKKPKADEFHAFVKKKCTH
ncbi:hypothetical protein PEC18_02570 [Paucibacter sp. O1-1]|nr:hypothetical protein [Paucibacter sp. O1-1]MDA3824762.1 hypothetical protein [Paucibacter sp. O1-1]